MKVLLAFVLIVSSLILINSSQLTKSEGENVLERCGAESILVGVTRMLDSFYEDRTNISLIISDTKRIISSITSEGYACLAQYFAQEEPMSFNSRLTDFGFLLLNTSNCLKDVGPVFIFLDKIISSVQTETKDWQDIIINSAIMGALSYQSYNDCKVLYDGLINYIRNRK